MSPAHACRSERGFTLIELLVAMVIFAILSAGMYTLFNSYQTTRDVTDRDARRLADLQRFFNQFGREMQQVVARPARDDFQLESPLPAVSGQSESIEFTRTGWNQPPFATHLRSELQRVAYYAEEGVLKRAQWSAIDRPDNLAPLRMTVLEGVEAVSFRYFVAGEENTPSEGEVWPLANDTEAASPPGQANAGKATAVKVDARHSLPSALQIRLKLVDYGEISRTFALVKEQW